MVWWSGPRIPELGSETKDLVKKKKMLYLAETLVFTCVILIGGRPDPAGGGRTEGL